jgi:hypothetical protein
MPTPQYFYHYTSINNLALILKSKKIRFTRADLVNDLDEINITDLPKIKTNVFISCWTAQQKESIPLWNLYADNLKGVRIKLKSPIFANASGPYISKHHGCTLINLVSLSTFIKRNIDYEWVKYLFAPIKVKYKKNNNVHVFGENESIIVKNIGTVKLDHWRFEKEYRFLALANHEYRSETDSFHIKAPPDFSEVKAEHLDIWIDEEIFHRIEILPGPKCQEPEMIVINSLLEKYTTRGKIKRMKSKIRIR